MPSGSRQTVADPDAGFFVMREAGGDEGWSFPTLVDFVTPREGDRLLHLQLSTAGGPVRANARQSACFAVVFGDQRRS